MPASLNNVATSDAYTAATTVEFARARPGFTLQVNNAAVYYKLGSIRQGYQTVEWEAGEHFLQPGIATFRNPTVEGLPADAAFGGIQLRSGATGLPAQVSVA